MTRIMSGAGRLIAGVAFSGVLWPFAAAPRAESATATVMVGATIGGSSLTVTTEDGWAQWTVTHAASEGLADAVLFTLPDGSEVSGTLFPAGGWAELWNEDGPSRLVREGPPEEQSLQLVALR